MASAEGSYATTGTSEVALLLVVTGATLACGSSAPVNRIGQTGIFDAQ
jgi:hypothetical protein